MKDDLSLLLSINKLFFPIIILLLSGGCASYHYSQVTTGKIDGRLTVQWFERDRFRFIPDEEDPLVFTRSNGDVIEPGEMATDGGSIPRPLWALKNYSPWGYAPGYIVHDWLFEANHCNVEEYADYSLKESGLVLSEVIKTMMEDEKYGGKNEIVLYSVYLAVTSEVAEELWNSGSCNVEDTAENELELDPEEKPITQYVINF